MLWVGWPRRFASSWTSVTSRAPASGRPARVNASMPYWRSESIETRTSAFTSTWVPGMARLLSRVAYWGAHSTPAMMAAAPGEQTYGRFAQRPAGVPPPAFPAAALRAAAAVSDPGDRRGRARRVRARLRDPDARLGGAHRLRRPRRREGCLGPGAGRGAAAGRLRPKPDLRPHLRRGRARAPAQLQGDRRGLEGVPDGQADRHHELPHRAVEGARPLPARRHRLRRQGDRPGVRRLREGGRAAVR